MISRAAKIKMSFYILMVFVLSIFLQLFPIQSTYATSLHERYKSQGNKIVFDSEGQVLSFISRARTATSSTRFRTIGWQVRFEPQDGSQKFYTRIGNDNVRKEEVHTDGFTYTEFVFPIAKSTGQQFEPSIVEALVRDFGSQYDTEYFIKKLASGVIIKFDTVASIIDAGRSVANAYMDSEGNIHPSSGATPGREGEHYLTKEGKSFVTTHKVKSGWETVSDWDTYYGGVKNARGWADPNMFNDYFDVTCFYEKEDVIVQRVVEAQHWTTSGTRLDAGGRNKILGVFDVQIGKTVKKDVSGLSFPGYKISHSYVIYNGTKQENYKEGSDALSQTVNIKADNDKHLVVFYYKPVELDTTIPDGQIKFEPNKSEDIGGNREGWVNQNIAVKVTANPASVTMYGTATRRYQYYDSCARLDKENNCVGETVTGSITVPFTQTWKVKNITVTGTGKNKEGKNVNLESSTVPQGGTFTINSELKDIQLTARVSEWEAQNDKRFIDEPPPLGNWIDSTPSGSTSKPNKDFKSNSGKYFLDKTKPQIDSVSPQNRGWTNQTVNVKVKVSDNLSGFYRSNSYVKAVDTSYYDNSLPEDYFEQGRTSAEKTISLAREGIYQVKVNLEDMAKNKISETTYGYYKIDKTKPDEAKFSFDNREYIDENLTVTVTVGDNLSGVVETRYTLTNSPNDKSDMKTIDVTTPEGKKGTNTFTVDITEPGSWWIHVYQRDRAGNVTETVSPEYRIIRLGHPDNDDGSDPFDENDETFWITPLQTNRKIPRGTRFDVHLKTFGLTEQDATITTVHMETPRWVTDDVMKKVNGRYAVTPGIFNTVMNYYSGYAEDALSFAKPTTSVRWWKAFIPPYGTPITVDANSNRLRPKYQIRVQLEFEGYSPSKTHWSTIEFDVVPETKLKTEIIKNEY